MSTRVETPLGEVTGMAVFRQCPGTSQTFLGLYRFPGLADDGSLPLSPVRFLSASHTPGNLMESLDARTAHRFRDEGALRDWFAALPPASKALADERCYRLCEVRVSVLAALHLTPAPLDPGGDPS